MAAARSQRSRAAPERLEATESITSSPSEIEMPKGDGTPLGEIPIVSHHLTKTLADQDAVKFLHKLLFGAVGASSSRKSNIRAFAGWGEDANVEKKIESLVNSKVWTVAALKDALQFLGLEKSGTTLDLAARLVNFLAKPHGNVKAAPAGKAAAKEPASKGTKRSREDKKPADGKVKKAKKPKKPEGYPKSNVTAFMHFSAEMRPGLKAKNPDAGVTDIAKLMGVEWKATEDKSKWEALAVADKKRFTEELAKFNEAQA